MKRDFELNGQMALLGQEDLWEDRTAESLERRTRPSRLDADLIAIPYLYLDLSPGYVDLFGNPYWELRSPYREGEPPLNTGPAPREPIRSVLSEVLEQAPADRYFLSARACGGILRRAEERGKPLPSQLEAALQAQTGMTSPARNTPEQTIPIAFAANQRDEVRDLHDVAGALGAQPGMKQQTFVAGFSAGAGSTAGSIGYSEAVAPTIKGSAGGNCMPSVLCLNDQGGAVMECSDDIA